MATANLPTYYVNEIEKTGREAEVPLADWDGGGNAAASNANGLGINTGNYGPKAQDFSQGTAYFAKGQIIGKPPTETKAIDATLGDAFVGFVLSTGVVAPDGIIADLNGFDVLNRTDANIPSGQWVWGVAEQP